MLAAVFGREEIVAVLLLAGADTSLRDARGLTAYEWSIRRGFHDVSQMIANAPGKRPQSSESVSRQPAPENERRADEPPYQLENERNPASQSDEETTGGGVATPKMGGAAAAILRDHVASPGEASRVIHSHSEEELDEPVVLFSEAVRASAEHETPWLPGQPQATSNQAVVAEPKTASEAQPPIDVASPLAAPDEQPATPIEPLSAEPVPEAPFATADLAPLFTANDSDAEQTSPSLAHVFSEDATAETSTAAPKADAVFERAEPSLIPSNPAVTTPTFTSSSDEDTTLFPSKDMRTSVPPAFLADSTPQSTSGRPLVWLLVAITLGGSAFAAYRLNNYFSRTQQAPVAATDMSQPAPVAPPNPAPVIGGDLAGAEVDVPQPDFPQNRASRSSTITVRVQVNQRGKVVSARSVDGDWSLRAAAVNAARRSTFSPEKLAGKRRLTTGTITYNFVPKQLESSAAKSQSATTSPPSDSADGATGQPAEATSPVTGGPLAGAETYLPDAEYPANARRQRIEEVITITVRVNRAGRVISWKTGSGNATLRAAALKAAKRSTFSPAKLPGSGEVVGTITYNFKLLS